MLTVANTANNNIWLLLHNDGFIRLVGALPQSSLLFFANDLFPQPNGDKKKTDHFGVPNASHMGGVSSGNFRRKWCALLR